MSQTEERQRGGRQPSSVTETTLFEQIVCHDNLLATFADLRAYGGQARGSDGRTYSDYGPSEAAGALREISRRIRADRYRPQPFRRIRIPKLGLTESVSVPGFRELSIATVLDRCVSTAVHLALTPTLDREFQPRSFGFRRGRSVWQLLLQIERDHLRTGYAILAQDDVRNAFPSVGLPLLFRYLQDYNLDRQLLRLIERMFRFEEGQRPNGLPQGDAFAPTCLNLVLHHVHDLPLSRDQRPDWYRYADNVAYLVPSPPDAEATLDRVKSRLNDYGLQLKGIPGGITDLNRRSARLLGFQLRLDQGRLRLSIPESTWTYLRLKLEDALRSPTPIATNCRIIRGWIRAFGPAFGNQKEQSARILNTCDDLRVEGPSSKEIRSLIAQARSDWDRLRGIFSGVDGLACTAPQALLLSESSDQLLVDERTDNPSSIPPWEDGS